MLLILRMDDRQQNFRYCAFCDSIQIASISSKINMSINIDT